MGLDMYFRGKRYLWSSSDDDAATAAAINKLFPELEVGQEVNEVTVELMYWRKANAIHKWFVDNVQDGVDECEEFEVSNEQLAGLHLACKSVLATPTDFALYLPTASGFFFGSTEPDEWYMKNITDTKEWLDKLLGNPETFKQWTFYYQSSW